MKTDLAAYQKVGDTTAAALARELANHPDLSSQELADRFGLSLDDLLHVYDVIRENKQLQQLVVEQSKAPRLTISTSELISPRAEYLTKMLTGAEVYPLILEFHAGPRCQCDCVFCFSGGWDYKEYAESASPIEKARVEQLFAECHRNGVEEVWFSGGKEPFVNPNTPEYLRMAHDTGLKTRLYTNGIAMTRSVQESVLGCYQVRVSLNGATGSTYGKVQFPHLTIQQASQIHSKVVENVSGLVKLQRERGCGPTIGISQILQPDNCHEMVQFADLAANLGADSVHFRLEAMGKVRDFTPEERELIRNEIAEIMKNRKGLVIDIRGVAEGEFESRENQFLPGLRKPTVCRAGMLKRGLNPYGALYNCEFSSHPRFRLTSGHLRLGDATNDSIGDILKRHIGKYPPTCELCQAHEYGLNITLERLEKDLEYGVPIERQPYYRGQPVS